MLYLCSLLSRDGCLIWAESDHRSSSLDVRLYNDPFAGTLGKRASLWTLSTGIIRYLGRRHLEQPHRRQYPKAVPTIFSREIDEEGEFSPAQMYSSPYVSFGNG